MQCYLRYRKAIIIAAISVLALLLFSSCTAKKAVDAEVFPTATPDSGSTADTPIANDRFGDDFVIDIEKPDIRGDRDDPDDPSDDQNQPGDDSGTSGTDVDSDIMSDYTGTDTVVGEDETDNDTSGDIPPNENPDVDPGDIIGGGQNTGAIKLYDVPLSAAKQSYAMQMAEEFGIPVELIYGVMYVESRYHETSVSRNGKCIGIMQIASGHLTKLNKMFGITDLHDYLQNVKAGAYYLSYFYKKYNGDINKTLMCYHYGEGGAHVQWRKGNTEDAYCRKVAGEMKRILAAG